MALTTIPLASRSLLAQQDSTVRIDERWHAYVGCWASYTDGVRGADLCVVPTRDSETVELMSLVRDSIITRTTIAATGERVMRTRAGCAGWDSARWSLDERRLYLRTAYTCAAGLTQVSTSIIALTSQNSFSRIDGARAGQATALRVVNYAALHDTAGLVEELLRRMPARDAAASRAARINSAAFVSIADVADASNALDAPVVEAWLADRGRVYTLTRDDVRSLRDVAVPASVIDVMLGRSHRELFVASPPATRQRRVRQRSIGGAAWEPAYTPFFHGIRAAESPVYSPGGWRLDRQFPPPVRIDVPLERIP